MTLSEKLKKMKEGTYYPAYKKLTNHQSWIAERLLEGCEFYRKGNKIVVYVDGDEVVLLDSTVEALRRAGLLK